MAAHAHLAKPTELAAEICRTLDYTVTSPLERELGEGRARFTAFGVATIAACECCAVAEGALAGFVVLSRPRLPDVPRVDALPAPLEALQAEVPLPVRTHLLALLNRGTVQSKEYHVSDVGQVSLKEVGRPDALLISHFAVA